MRTSCILNAHVHVPPSAFGFEFRSGMPWHMSLTLLFVAWCHAAIEADNAEESCEEIEKLRHEAKVQLKQAQTALETISQNEKELKEKLEKAAAAYWEEYWKRRLHTGEELLRLNYSRERAGQT